MRGIISEIEKQAEAEAQSILRSANRVAEREMESASKKAAAWRETVEARLHADAERRVKAARAEALGEASSILLKKRTTLLNEVIELALEQLRQLPRDDGYFERLRQYALEGAESLEIEAGIVRCNARDCELLNEGDRFGALQEYVNEEM